MISNNLSPKTGDDLMGYSQPHVVVKSPEASADIATLEISGSWGAGVANENHVIAVTADSVNVASCSQNAPGYPAELSIKFQKNGIFCKSTVITFCRKRIFHASSRSQQTLDFNKSGYSSRIRRGKILPNSRARSQRAFQTIVSCVAVSGNETKEVELGTLNVMHEPENVKISRTPDQITCSAEFSKYDEVTASLVSFILVQKIQNIFQSLNRNVLEKMEDGKAIFELSRFTEAEIAKIDSNGLK